MTLSDFVKQAQLRFAMPVPDSDTAFQCRRQCRLATDCNESLMNAADLSVNDTARVLLPLYESWAMEARNKRVNL